MGQEFIQLKKKCKRPGCFEPSDCRHGYCKNHCQQRHRLQDYHSGGEEPRTNEPHLGLELECIFNCYESFKRGIAFARAESDCSLDDAHGAEFKLLATTHKMPSKAHRLIEELWTRRARVTTKCGMHVHIDVRQVKGMGRFDPLFSWAYYSQEEWFALMPPSRRNNSRVRRLREAFPSIEHYDWINKTRWDTVEIRLHGGTVNPFKVRGWIAICAHLQAKILDLTYTFPAMGTAKERFDALFADASSTAREYIAARRAGNGIIRDHAYESVES